jgi:hypothetical protein
MANCEARSKREKDDATTIDARQDSPADLADHCVGGPGRKKRQVPRGQKRTPNESLHPTGAGGIVGAGEGE